jgi:hypothetical protein
MTFFWVDMNKTSLHSFYRDRLSKAYLIQVDDNDCIAQNDTQKLSELNNAVEAKVAESASPAGSLTPSARAPYHLINATLNSHFIGH